VNDNIQTEIILEFQKSIDNMVRFGQEMETLDSRFGNLERRIDSLRSSLSSLQSQVSRGAGSNLRQQIQRELNDLIAGNGILVREVGGAPFQIYKETVRDVFQKVETELNTELRKYVRNMHIEIDPNYAKGQRLPIANEDFEAINREVARVIKLQIQALVNAIQKHNKNLISPETLDGLQLEISKGTVQALVNKIKQEVVNRIQNPNVSDAGELRITRNDLQKVVNQVKSKLKEAFDVDVADVKSLDARDVNARVRRIPEEIDARLAEYVDKTVAGINAAMKGRMEIPVSELSRSLKRAIARELNVTVDQLEQQLGTIDVASTRMYDAKRQLERVAKALDKKLGGGLQKEIDDIVKRIEEVEISYSPKLKRHLINQINRINNKIIEKIREQVDVQVNHLLQEIEEVQARPKKLNRDRQIRNANEAVSGGSENRTTTGNSFADDTRRRAPVITGRDPYARRDEYFNSFGLQGAVINTVRHILAGSIVGAPLMAMYQAVETFKNTQMEQIKMFQNLMLKDTARTDFQGNKLPEGQINYGKLDYMLKDIQSFVRQQSLFYGIDYNQMYQVAGIGSRLLDTPAEIKKFVQYTAQLKTLDPASDVMKLANGLEAMKAQFRLEVADLGDKIVKPLAAVSNVTNASIEELLEALKRSASTFEASNIDPRTAVVLSGVSIQSTGLEGANIGNFYKSILMRLQSTKALQQMEQLGVNPYNTDPVTGGKILKEGEEIFKELAQALKNKDDKTRRDVYDALFGTYQSSKGAATLHEITDNYVKVMAAVDSFEQKQFMDMLRKSLQNPMVNMNRAQESFNIALDAIMQELTPAINKVSYALINMADSVARNAQLFVGLGDILSNVLLGMLMLRGIRWGWNKAGIPENFDMQKQRTAYVRNIAGFLSDPDIRHLFGSEFEKSDRELRSQAALIQRSPILEKYLRELNSMSKEQQEHFKKYLAEKKIDIQDLPTLFTAMEEAKGWTARKELTDDERFDRSKVYTNRLSTNAALSNIINPNFMQTMLNSTANKGAFDEHRSSVLGYSDVMDRMSRMSQSEFDAFERHLEEMHRNGAPAIDSIERLSAALNDYEQTQRQAEATVRQSSPTYTNLANAMRGLNNEVSRTEKLKNGFKQFLRDIPDLARGAGASIRDLAGGITKLAAEIAAVVGLAEAGKALMWEATSTEDQRMLANADKQDADLKAAANSLRIVGENGVFSFANFANVGLMLYGSAMNFIDRLMGSDPSHFGIGNAKEIMDGVREMYNARGAGLKDNEDLANYLKANNISTEEAVRAWAEQTGRTKEIEKLREEAFIKQYEQAQLKKKEEEELLKKAQEAYEKKYKEGQLGKFPTISADEVSSRVRENLQEIRNANTVETLRNLMSGMKTDSEEYIQMRKNQVAKMRQVLNEELAVIDRYIANMVEIMSKASPESDQYKEAEKTKKQLEETRKKIADETEADILQEEFNLQQERFQKQLGKVNRNVQRAELIAQARELAASYNMDRESVQYIDALRTITQNKINAMKIELENMKQIQAMGDQTEELAQNILQLQNQIASEQLKLKEYQLSRISALKETLSIGNSEREVKYLEARVRLGNPDENSPVLRNIRIAQARQEIQQINQLIAQYRKQLPGAGTEEAKRIQQEIRDLMKQSLQAQLGILDELKGTAGTFNLPDGITATTRYEYLTRGNTHQTFTIGSGDVTVHITLPNVTGNTSQSQLRAIGQGIGQGILWGRAGSLRDQMLFNPGNYRPRIP
jgi:hypothetical protein